MIKKNIGFFLSIIFIIIGAVFCLISIIGLNHNNNFKSNSVKLTATITGIDRHMDNHDVYVTYNFEGQEFKEPLHFYSSGMRVGQETTIYVDPKSPNRIQSKGMSILWIFFFSMGAVFLVSGIIIFLLIKKKKRLKKKLLEDGTKVYAEISEVTINGSYTVNGTNPFIIICKWVDPLTGLFYFYKSENMWFNPEPILRDRNIKQLPVYIDRENPKNYVVSLEELERLLGNSY